MRNILTCESFIHVNFLGVINYSDTSSPRIAIEVDVLGGLSSTSPVRTSRINISRLANMKRGGQGKGEEVDGEEKRVEDLSGEHFGGYEGDEMNL